MLVKGCTINYSDLMKPNTKVYIYRIFSSKNSNMYIGKTVNVAQRLKSHRPYLGQDHLLGNPQYWKIEIIDIVKINQKSNDLLKKSTGDTEEQCQIAYFYKNFLEKSLIRSI